MSDEEEEDTEETMFIPKIRKGYKYLGLVQLEKDLPEENFTKLEEKMLSKTKMIFNSKLTTLQKRKLFNTAVIPAGIYITGNIFPSERVTTTIKRASELDMKIRKIAVNENLKSRPTSNSRFYLPQNLGGMGFRSLEVETCIQYVRRYAYLMCKEEMQEARKAFEVLNKGKCRNPISDFKYVKEKYKLTDIKMEKLNYREVANIWIKEIKQKDLELRKKEWSKAMNYPKQVLQFQESVDFPGLSSRKLDSSKASLLAASSEEQVFFKAKTYSTKGKDDQTCRFGCNEIESNYHVVTSCKYHSYTRRHDMVVYNILKRLKEKYKLDGDLQYGRSVFNGKKEKIRIRSGHKFLTEQPLVNNKPDIVITMKEGKKKIMYILEMSIPHI